jgi:hypothetical protein
MTLQKKMGTKGSDKVSKDEFPQRERKQKTLINMERFCFVLPASYLLFIHPVISLHVSILCKGKNNTVNMLHVRERYTKHQLKTIHIMKTEKQRFITLDRHYKSNQIKSKNIRN